jgi:hypothetical protein
MHRYNPCGHPVVPPGWICRSWGLRLKKIGAVDFRFAFPFEYQLSFEMGENMYSCFFKKQYFSFKDATTKHDEVSLIRCSFVSMKINFWNPRLYCWSNRQALQYYLSCLFIKLGAL